MKIYVNDKEMNISHPTSVQELVTSLELPSQGIALAVNNKMIPRSDWKNTYLESDAHIVIIKAACGG